MSQVEFKIEKEVKWDSVNKVSKDIYYVWAGSACVEVAYDLERAEEVFEKVKSNWRPSSSEIIKKEVLEIA